MSFYRYQRQNKDWHYSTSAVVPSADCGDQVILRPFGQRSWYPREEMLSSLVMGLYMTFNWGLTGAAWMGVLVTDCDDTTALPGVSKALDGLVWAPMSCSHTTNLLLRSLVANRSIISYHMVLFHIALLLIRFNRLRVE